MFKLTSVSVMIAVLLPLTVLAKGGPKINQRFPDFELKVLGGSGSAKLKSYKGKVLVIDFWASWCEPCKKELPGLNKLYAKYKSKGVEVIGVNVDDQESSATGFIKEHPVTFKLAFDQGQQLVKKCGLESMPSSFILDKKGVIKFIHRGFSEGDIEKFEKEIKQLL